MLKVEKIMRALSQEDVRQQSVPIQVFVDNIGTDIDYYLFREIFWQFGAGEFDALPLVCICTRDEINGALSGYDTVRNTILIANDFAQSGEEAQVVAVLVQEVITSITLRSVYRDLAI